MQGGLIFALGINTAVLLQRNFYSGQVRILMQTIIFGWPQYHHA